jgi:hypothetical protein
VEDRLFGILRLEEARSMSSVSRSDTILRRAYFFGRLVLVG